MTTRATGQQPRRGQLYLLFGMGSDRYALDVRDVLEVMPLRRLKRLPEAPAWVAGVFDWRGAPVPVLDLGALAFGEPARPRTSTRLVMVRHAGHSLGLVLEQATETLRCQPEEFQDYGLDGGEARYLGPVLRSAQGLVQRVEVAELLGEEARALLFPADAEATS
ncbi:chemotaxis protein CheW [Pseudomonas sp. USHLN015]|uniref:chemotaxis protein CheW n=1 Tax=Pseudomonas sp. USHLN015 TaxID=3081296 RepID=UPI00301C6FDE